MVLECMFVSGIHASGMYVCKWNKTGYNSHILQPILHSAPLDSGS